MQIRQLTFRIGRVYQDLKRKNGATGAGIMVHMYPCLSNAVVRVLSPIGFSGTIARGRRFPLLFPRTKIGVCLVERHFHRVVDNNILLRCRVIFTSRYLWALHSLFPLFPLKT